MIAPVSGTGQYREWSSAQKPFAELHLRQCDALAGQARVIWFSLLAGSTYCWLTIATLDDVQIFVPTKDLKLPLVGIDVSPVAFFVAAPLVLLAGFIHFQFTLARFWRFFVELREIDRADGTGIETTDRLIPWIVSQMPRRDHANDFPSLVRIVAIGSGWVVVPATIFALGYRYLRAHDLLVSLFHCFVCAVAIVACCHFYALARKALKEEVRDRKALKEAARDRNTREILFCIAVLFVVLAIPTRAVIVHAENALALPPFLAVNARLQGAAITAGDTLKGRKLENALRTLSTLMICNEMDMNQAGATPVCRDALKPPRKDTTEHATFEAAIVEIENEIAALLDAAVPPDIGFVPRSHSVNRQDETYCRGAAHPFLMRNLRLADLRQANLNNAGLRCIDLTRADLREARLLRAQLFGAILQSADLSSAHLEGADLRLSRLVRAELVSTHLGGADLWKAEISNSNFSRADLSAARLRAVAFIGSSFNATLFRGADLRDTRFVASYLRGADFTEAILSCSQGSVCTRFHHSYLDAVRFGKADLSGFDFTGSALRCLDLREVGGLSTERLEAAFGDGTVQLPDGIKRPGNWREGNLEYGDFLSAWQDGLAESDRKQLLAMRAFEFLAPGSRSDPDDRGPSCNSNPGGRVRDAPLAAAPAPARTADAGPATPLR